MMNQGEKIPLLVLEVLKTFYDTENPLFEKVNPDKALIKLKSTRPGSTFYFNILEERILEGKNQILIDYQPYKKVSVQSLQTWIQCDTQSVKHHITSWINLLEKYLEDDFLSINAQDLKTAEFESYFKITDEVHHLPLSMKEIPIVYQYLLDFEKSVEDNRDPKFSRIREELIVESTQLRESLSTSTRGKLVKNLSKLFAKSSKLGTTFLYKTLQHFHATITSESTKWLINGNDDLFGLLN